MSEGYIPLLHKRLVKCTDKCKYFYVKHIYKNDTTHYELYCTNHGYRATSPRYIALDDIQNGAVVVDKGTEYPTYKTFKNFKKQTGLKERQS